MKKLFNLIFVAILALGLISCDKLLKDPKSEGAGWGDVVFNKSNVAIGSNLSVKTEELDFDNAVFTIDDTENRETTLGKTIQNVTSGVKKIGATVPSLDGSMNYVGSGTITVEANKLLNAVVVLTEAKSATNAWKFVFDPSKYGVTVNSEVHLVGDLPAANWTPSNMSYPLAKQADGTWVGYFDLDAGKKFKFIYDSTSWNGHDIGNGGSNFTIAEMDGVIEEVLAWQFTFDPSKYSVTVANEVHLVGSLPGINWKPSDMSYPLVKQSNGTWVGYFDIPTGTEFKFIYDSTSWNGHDIGDNGSNFTIGEKDGVMTQSF